jgi:hypothetical protein
MIMLIKTFLQDCASELKLLQKLKDEIRDLSAQLSNVQFIYRDPVRNFDRSKVKGVVAKLIKVNDSSTMTALEVSNAHIICLVLSQQTCTSSNNSYLS